MLVCRCEHEVKTCFCWRDVRAKCARRTSRKTTPAWKRHWTHKLRQPHAYLVIGWKILQIHKAVVGILNFFFKMDLFIAAYDSILGSSFIRTPDSVANKHATVNVKNDGDEFCFLYFVLAQIYPCKNNRHQTYNYQKQLEKKL